MKQVAILHYASPPTVGGVESTIAYQARGLVRLGYRVRVISGAGGDFDPQIETCINPLFGSMHPDILAVKAELDAGKVTSAFSTLMARLTAALRLVLEGCDVCIAHNIPSLHKNLPLTAALARLNATGAIRVIAWCHDLAWTNELYLRELHRGYPYNLLRQAWPNTRYVTVSQPRQQEVSKLLGVDPDAVKVVVPGIDPARFFRWTPTTEKLVSLLGLLDADGILLLPARLTRRKNIFLALQILAEIRHQSERDFRLMVTGPPGPHNPKNRGYLGELVNLQNSLGLENAAHFLYAYGDSDDAPLLLDEDSLADLFHLADALLFPSTQEGFGIPILEAGLAGIPVFCADIPPLRESGGADVVYFDPLTTEPGQVAARILKALNDAPTFRLRVRVRQSYRWDLLIRDHIVPLLEEV
jgi:glycosyltransferase involved in cell wall biosynthesis